MRERRRVQRPTRMRFRVTFKDLRWPANPRNALGGRAARMFLSST